MQKIIKTMCVLEVTCPNCKERGVSLVHPFFDGEPSIDEFKISVRAICEHCGEIWTIANGTLYAGYASPHYDI